MNDIDKALELITHGTEEILPMDELTAKLKLGIVGILSLCLKI